jgi:pimeloyl-ACP methyl ester carboxylesterase
MERPPPWTHQLGRWHRQMCSRLALRYPPFGRLLSTRRPMSVIRRQYEGTAGPRDLLVLLPGIGDYARDFETQQFLRLLRATDWSVDVWMVDAHYGYYADRTIIEQLHRDVLGPAHTAGYRQVWLGGVSLGGFGSLLYASHYGEGLTGVLALAPFLGEPDMIHEIVTAGGLAAWVDRPAGQADIVRMLWRWLHETRIGPPRVPRIYLGFGEQDIFARAHTLLAAHLPSEQVLTSPGGHDWLVWERLWQDFLRRRPH